MNKDVIYIDVDDDITAIIGKIKLGKEKIIALVPPKRVGILQSAVNLRLLARAATDSNKHLVLITNNKALMALSAASMIPVAKNLQSKPEIAQLPEVLTNEEDDIIEGSQLPVGDLVKTADYSKNDDVIDLSDDIKSINIDDETEKVSENSTKKGKPKSKVPNFSAFRKKIFIGIAAAILLIVFFVWANVFASSARIIVTTSTSPAPISAMVKLSSTDPTNVTKNTIQTITKQIKKDVSVQFDATGTKDLGEKSKGSVTFSNCSSSQPKTIPAGTILTNNGQNYLTLAQAEVGAGSFDDGVCVTAGVSSAVNIIAANAGSSYDTSANANFSVSGYSSNVSATSANGISGGSTKIATVVTAEDIQKASQALADLSSDPVRSQLIRQFDNDEIIITDSFNVDHATAVSTPALDNEATSKPRLTSSTTFSLTAIAKSEVKLYLKGVYAKQLEKGQKVYDDGLKNIKLSGYLKNDKGSTVNFSTSGKIGPSIDIQSIKNQSKGKRYGEVQSTIGAVDGVTDVDIKFSYFWVNTVPNDINKIDVEFILENA